MRLSRCSPQNSMQPLASGAASPAPHAVPTSTRRRRKGKCEAGVKGVETLTRLPGCVPCQFRLHSNNGIFSSPLSLASNTPASSIRGLCIPEPCEKSSESCIDIEGSGPMAVTKMGLRQKESNLFQITWRMKRPFLQ